MFGPRSFIVNPVIYSSIAAVATFVQLVVGRIALVFILVYLFSMIKQKFYNCNIKNILNHLYS